MRRSICYSEPSFARAGEISTWHFHYTTSTALPKGSKLKFDLQTQGRGVDWEVPSTELSDEANVIYATLEDDTLLEATEVEVPDSFVPQYEFVLPEALKVGGKITIVVGTPVHIEPDDESGNACQLMTGRRRPFYLYIDPKGKGNYDEPEVFSMDIRGNVLDNIRILTPSFVSKNKRFDITVRFEDEYGNLTSNAPEGTLINLSYEHLRENLNWKLFVPETGFVILPNLYFNEAGLYRIKLQDTLSKKEYISSPIKCFNENDRNLFWGFFHGESERVDSTENIESCLRHFRDEKHLNFFGTSPFETSEETSTETWKLISQNVADFNEEERFCTFLGFQYVGESGTEGTREILYLKDNKPLSRQKESKSSSLQKLYKLFSAKEFISVPTFTMGGKHAFDFTKFDPTVERVVEIYNAWGSSMCTAKEGNSRPITFDPKEKTGAEIEENPVGSVVAALKKGHRFGFVAGGLDDRGIYAPLFESSQVQYSPGLTGVIAPKHTREAIFEALHQRSCYATTGARIILGFHIAGHRMGQELSSDFKPGLKVNRHLSGYVAGEDVIKTIEILRNGEVIYTHTPTTYHSDYYYDDMEPLSSVVLPAPEEGSPFVFYFLRVTQADGHVAWSSPIWVEDKT